MLSLTGTEWLSGLHDGFETSEQWWIARWWANWKECKHRQNIQYVTAKFNIRSDRILGQIIRRLLNLKHHPFTRNKPPKTHVALDATDEANAGDGLPTRNIPTEVKISSPQIWVTPRNHDKS